MKPKVERDYSPLSPGAVLQERIFGRLGMSQAALAKALGVSRSRSTRCSGAGAG